MLDSRDISKVCTGAMSSPVKKVNGNSRRKRTPPYSADRGATTPTHGKSQPMNIANTHKNHVADANYHKNDSSGGSSDGSLSSSKKGKNTTGGTKHKIGSNEAPHATRNSKLSKNTGKTGKKTSSTPPVLKGKFGTAGNGSSTKKNHTNNNNTNNNLKKSNVIPRVQSQRQGAPCVPQSDPADFYAAGDYSYSAPEPSALPPPPMGWLSNNSPLARSSELMRGGVRSYESSPTMVSEKEAYNRSAATNDLRTLLHVV
ncbi:hypothetical protein SARC_11239 [Sphaeroforma arctica JP610]|uniref:Uncharacterized protein n=1 Tax=Sphaeroforma arctica JP610 TaxID=667725 RepID=A0A0L0FIF5_9EUKA|nr:hypothetical protein SARC_11239 [Sphaeroforma arctica JP610]KNC76251.1 hypothetical protein SARC_11239 [Sphaeroforma arctica JP610]|eukprot:XP_014150153.1 hypothetical protein SARC_11239 [Sphaeroforma arctica JP610]